jgi:hypothetical protein
LRVPPRLRRQAWPRIQARAQSVTVARLIGPTLALPDARSTETFNTTQAQAPLGQGACLSSTMSVSPSMACNARHA